MKIVYLVVGALVLLPVVAWIAALIWAAIKDGGDQKARDAGLDL